MRKSVTILIGFNRGTFLLFAAIFGLIIFSVTAWRSNAQEDNIQIGTSVPAVQAPQAPPQCTINGFWEPKAARSSDSEGAGAASDNTFAYYAGGYSAVTGVSNRFEKYNPITNTWTTLQFMPTGVLAPSVVYFPLDHNFYVFGGENGAFSPLNILQIYHSDTGTWTTGPSMPAPRSAMAVSFYGGEIYLAGGYGTAANTSAQSTVWKFNPVTGIYTNLQPMPFALAGSVYGGLSNGHLIVAGGLTPANTVSNLVFDYSAITNTWAQKANMPIGLGFAASGIIDPANGSDPLLFAIGGGNFNNPFNPGKDTEVYDPVTNTWSIAPNLNTGRYFSSATAVGNNIVVSGGFNGTTLSSAEALSVSCLSFTSIDGYVTLPEFTDPNISLAGISVNLTGSSTLTTTTDATGHYHFDFLPSGGNFTVTPSGINVFDAQSLSFNNLTVGAENVSFIRYLTAADVPRNLNLLNAYLTPGGVIRMPISITSQGNEKSFAFSVNFDPSLLSLLTSPTVTCGSSDPGCSITVDTSLSGKLGIIMRPVNQITAGEREIGIFGVLGPPPNFNLFAPAISNPPINFGDAPTPRRITDANNNPRASRYTNAFVILTDVTVSGQVVTPDGRGLRNATVSLTDSNNVVRTATTSSFGFYSFTNVTAGQSYTARVGSRLYRFSAQTFSVVNDLTLPNFVGQE